MSISYQQELLHQVESDIKPLLEKHWEEIALNKDRIKLNPDWEAYDKLEREGKLSIFTARDAGTLVGYFVVISATHIHYKDHVFASNDIIYLSPEYRKGFVGIRLIKFAEKCLREDGVSVFLINMKEHRPFSKVVERLGFNLTETIYSKFLGDK